MPGQPQGDDAAHQRERNVAQDQHRLAGRAEGGEQHHEDQPKRHRYYQSQPCCRTLLILELPAPGQMIAGGQRYLGGDRRTRLFHEADQVASAHIGLHQGESRAVFAVHGDRAIDHFHACQ